MPSCLILGSFFTLLKSTSSVFLDRLRSFLAVLVLLLVLFLEDRFFFRSSSLESELREAFEDEEELESLYDDWEESESDSDESDEFELDDSRLLRFFGVTFVFEDEVLFFFKVRGEGDD